MISACEHGELDQNPHINEFMRTPLKKSAELLLSDNFFDMLPGERRVKVLRGCAEKGLRVRSVYDIDKKEI